MDEAVILQPEETKLDPPIEGYHNSDLEASRKRILREAIYKDCSTYCILPVKDSTALHWKVALAQRVLMSPMNNKFFLQPVEGLEVAEAYNQGLRILFSNPELKKWKFILTMEHDNAPPPDGLLRLVETMWHGPWAAAGGLYWTKGEGGQPMIYGNPLDPEINFRPQPPKIGEVQECRGVAMGFTLWDRELFEDKKLFLEGSKPEEARWFQTVGSWDPYSGAKAGTQDLEFCARAAALGYRFCVDNRVRVGHVQLEATPTHPAGFVW